MNPLFKLLLLPLVLCAAIYRKATDDWVFILVIAPLLAWLWPTMMAFIIVIPLAVSGGEIAKSVIVWGSSIAAAAPIAIYLSVVIGFFAEIVYALSRQKN